MKPHALLQTPEFNILVFSFLLNFVWESWQVPFFRDMTDLPHWIAVKACTFATLGDSAIALTSFWVAAARAGTRSWVLEPRLGELAVFMGLGILATIVLEGLATGILGRWAYSDNMPRLPVLGTGLLPIVQWIVIPLLVIWFVRRQSGKK